MLKFGLILYIEISFNRINVNHIFQESKQVASLPAEPEFLYTLDECGVLDEHDRRFFEENGFFVVRGLISKANIEKFTQRFHEICKKEVSNFV